MDIEKLKQEAIQYACDYPSNLKGYKRVDIRKAYLAGAEPREKRITELEADNDARKFAMNMSEIVEKQLREENAELKAELEENKDLPAIAYQQGAEWWKKKTDSKLAKAKFLLKQLVDAFPKSYSDVVKDTLDEARKFVEE